MMHSYVPEQLSELVTFGVRLSHQEVGRAQIVCWPVKRVSTSTCALSHTVVGSKEGRQTLWLLTGPFAAAAL